MGEQDRKMIRTLPQRREQMLLKSPCASAQHRLWQGQYKLARVLASVTMHNVLKGFVRVPYSMH